SIDNEHVIAWDANLDYDIKVASGMFGFTSGEGLVNHFTGDGKVLIQTRNLHSLAEAL
ncbi:TIGR00266 family protein, partial [Lactobacillus delbrueckii subsp. bulgaricus]|nr:TIGR00266 family protein [Lactobacillus delbrueckii subsp. bulgaricus]